MTKKEKLLVLEALKKDAIKRMENANSESVNQYQKGRVDALNDAIAVLRNGEDGNAIKEVYLGKE